jgi:hypothetical protein
MRRNSFVDQPSWRTVPKNFPLNLGKEIEDVGHTALGKTV